MFTGPDEDPMEYERRRRKAERETIAENKRLKAEAQQLQAELAALRPAAPDADKPEGEAELRALRQNAVKQNDEICQVLGKALGYPWFKDDQKNFPGATEANGVCVGDHVAESIADEAARRIIESDARLSVAVEAGDVWWLSGDPENTFTDAERAFEEALEWAEDDQPEMPVALGRANYLPDVWAVRIDGKLRLFATKDAAATALRQIEGG